MRHSADRTDRGYMALVSLLLVVMCWLLAMPFSPFIQQATLNRFHLQSSSFVLWAAQAPVPAMYNFHNRYRVEVYPDAIPSGERMTGTLNHFPVRLYTFGNSRSFMLRDPARHTLTVESRYRGRVLTTRWRVRVAADGKHELTDEVVP
jgi:hypothetical protein